MFCWSSLVNSEGIGSLPPTSFSILFNIGRGFFFPSKISFEFWLNARHHTGHRAACFASDAYVTLTATLWHSGVNSWHMGASSWTGVCRWPWRDLSSRPEWAVKSQGDNLHHEAVRCSVRTGLWALTVCVWIPAPVLSNFLGNLCHFSVPYVLNWHHSTHLIVLLWGFSETIHVKPWLLPGRSSLRGHVSVSLLVE